MIIFLLNIYLALLFLLVKLRIVRFNLFWKVSPFLVLLLLMVGLFIPMGWGAPSGPVLLGRHSVPIVPDVAGEVIEIVAEPNKPLKANDVLFRIDPTPYEAQVKALEAQLSLAELRLSQMTQLQRSDAGRGFDVQQRESEVKQLQAQLEGARWNLDKTTVIYNPRITMMNIPLEAYDYVVNGKSALEWVMERQVVKTDADSGIVNDANRYAIETVGDPAYLPKLFQRVITVSLETMKIVRNLPALDIMNTTLVADAGSDNAAVH